MLGVDSLLPAPERGGCPFLFDLVADMERVLGTLEVRAGPLCHKQSRKIIILLKGLFPEAAIILRGPDKKVSGWPDRDRMREQKATTTPSLRRYRSDGAALGEPSIQFNFNLCFFSKV